MARNTVKTQNTAGRKKRSASAVAEFKSNVPYFFRDAWLAMLTRFAAVLEEDRVADLEQAVAAHLERNGLPEMPPAHDQPFMGYTRFALAVAQFVNYGYNLFSREFRHNLEMTQSRDPGVYSFRLGNPRLKLQLGPTNIPGAEHAFQAKDPFSPYIKYMKSLGLDFEKDQPIKTVFISSDYEQPNWHRLADFNGKETLGVPTHQKTIDLIQTGVLSCNIHIEAEVTDNLLSVTPYLHIDIDKTIYDNIVEYEGERQEPLYIYMWMMQAVQACSGSNIKRWKGTSVVDLRTVSRKLRHVRSTYGKAKARVNEDGFSIGGEGFPLYLPEVDLCSDYVNTISKSTKLEDGIYNFAESHMQWANKLIMIDWFNDYVLYANTVGELQHMPLLGVRPLDPASEMMFLETPVNLVERLFKLIQSIGSLISENVSSEEAVQFLDQETKDFFGAVEIPSVHIAVAKMMEGHVDRSRERSSYSNKSTIAVKHLLGMDIEELYDTQSDEGIRRMRAYGAAVRAYFRALYKKRGKLDLPVMTRLNGMEYMLYAAEKYSTLAKWQERRTQHSQMLSEMNSNFKFGSTIDLPNLTIGPRNIEALMPHQVNYLSAMRDGVSAGAGGIATGGGKGLLSPLDIIQQMALGKIKRPLIATKPRLVKENITEINRISGGKINVVPLRTRNIRHLKRKAGLKTAKDFLTWAKSLPANTIFICAYSDFGTRATLFEDLDVPGRALWYDVQLSQLVHLLRLIGIDMVYDDESHLIKNMKSRRSRCSYSVSASADQTRIATGTLTPNTPKDTVGQFYALNPMIFGNNVDEFEKVYNIKGGLLKTDDDARRLSFRMTELSRTFFADEEDWAFVLPTFMDDIVYSRMTPLQEEFYNILLQRASLEMRAKLDELKSKGKVKIKLEEDEGDDEDGEDGDDELDEDDFEDEDSKFIALATATLAAVEQFIAAPDANDEYVRWVKRPTGDDLISPLVRSLDTFLDQHFKAIPKERLNEEKVLVFGWHKVVSRHLFKHSRWARSGLHYGAGDEENVRKFKTERDKLILFADEGSLREGENLQMCSVVARMQPVWTPGDYKQAAARAYRPDPRGTYANRENVRHIWFIVDGNEGRPTVSSVKLSSMISKAISNARLKYGDEPEWRRISPEFENLRRLRMNFDLIFNTTEDDIKPYMNKWSKFNRWVADRVYRAKVREAERLEREFNVDLIKNGKIIDIKAFLKLAMRPITSNKDLPGSRRVYVPWELQATPADVYHLDLEVLGGREILPGTPVMTEFGAALAINPDNSDRSMKVELYGGKTITLRRAAIAIPGSDTGRKRLKAIISNKQQWKATYQSPRIRSTATAQDIGEDEKAPLRNPPKGGIPTPKVDTKPKKPLPEAEDDSAGEDHIEVSTQIINGWPFLVIDAADAPPAFAKLRDWRKVEPYMAITFLSWNQVDSFLDVLVDKFYLRKSKFDSLLAEMDLMRNGRAMRLVQRLKDSEVRSFFLAQHKLKGKAKDGRFVIDPYWIGFEDTVYLVFDRKSHSPSVLNWLQRAKTRVKGMRISQPNEGFYVYGFKTLNEAETALKSAAKYLNFDADQTRQEIKELREDLKQFNTKKVAPTKRRAR